MNESQYENTKVSNIEYNNKINNKDKIKQKISYSKLQMKSYFSLHLNIVVFK